MIRTKIARLSGRIITGLVIFLGIIALFSLVTGNFGAFIGITILGVGFYGLGWTARRIMLGGQPESPPIDLGHIIAIVFGGAGVLMLIGSIALLVSEEFEGAIGLGVFGAIFCSVGYIGKRVFSAPKGKKRVLVSEQQKNLKGSWGRRVYRTSKTYAYVPEGISIAEIEQMQADWVKKPWTQREDWRTGRIVQESAGGIGFLTGFTVLWNLIGWTIGAYLILNRQDSATPWFLFIFPLSGLVLIFITIRTWIRKRKFGISIFNLEKIPVHPGERFTGLLKTGVYQNSISEKGFRLRLICTKRYSSTDKDNKKRVSEKELWSQEQFILGRTAGAAPGLEVFVNMFIPAEVEQTSAVFGDDRILWRLHVSADTKGVNYSARFEIPVFRYVAAASKAT